MGTSVIELRCEAPGLIKKNREIMSTVILAHGDEFSMADLDFKYLLDEAQQDGKNVLSGRL